MSDRFDVVVVGAGPGGMAAATVVAEAGKRVCLVDDNASPGGQIWRGFRAETARKYPHGSGFLVPRQPRQLEFVQSPGAGHAVEDL